MDKTSIIKWVLIAGAAYLVYRYLDTQGFFGSATPALPAPQPATGAATTTTAQVQAPAPATAPSVDAISQALSAAIRAASMDPSGSYDGYQWAWFWGHTPLFKNETMGPTELQMGQTETVPLASAAAKIRAILSPGMAGLQALMADRRLMSAWAM